VRLAFAGTPAVAVPALQALLDSPHDVVAVITRPDAPAGRGKKITASPIAELARERGIEVLQPLKPSEPHFQARLREIAPECIPVVAYGALVPRAALDIPPQGWVNLHFSLLPAWRGAAPVQHSILHGDEITGATTFLLEEGMDTGPVYGTMTETIRPTDTSGDLLERLATAGAGLLLATIDGIASGQLTAVPQPADGVSMAPKLNPPDVQVDWKQPGRHIDRLIRAGTPAPGPWTTLRGRRVKLGPATLALGAEELPPGEILDRGKDGVLVGTATQPVRLGQVQPEGKGMMNASDWARGLRLERGEAFE
jgi:methionyl-tRNA formyltransferase